jgi:hypothetical protein
MVDRSGESLFTLELRGEHLVTNNARGKRFLISLNTDTAQYARLYEAQQYEDFLECLVRACENPVMSARRIE